MSPSKLPFMPFYGADFYDDEKVCLMGLEEEAIYLRLLWRQWREGSLPTDAVDLAGVARVPSVSSRVLACFLEGEDGRRRNPRLERIRAEQEAVSSKLSEAGKRGRAKQLAGPPPGQAQAGLGQSESDTESEVATANASHSADAAQNQTERREPEHTLRSCVGLVVEHLYSGNRPPEAAMRNEASIARQLGERHGFDRLARAIQGLARRRDSGEFPNIRPQQAMSLKWIHSKKFDINQLAASEDAFYRSDPEPRRGRGKATDIGDIVASITPRAG